MKRHLWLLLVLVFLTACSSTLDINDLYYLKDKDNSYFLTSLDGKLNNKIQIDKRIRNFKILQGGKTYIIDVLKSPGVNIDSNALLFMSDSGRTKSITGEYAAEDLKISPDGSQIAYTSYSSDDLNSYKGIFITDINGNRQRIETSKMVTQGLYEWLDNENILFYGIDIEKKDLSKIYKYNIKNKEESIFYDGISGYCSFFSVNAKNNTLIIDDGNISDRKLKIIDLKTKSADNIEFIYDSIYDVSISKDGKFAAIVANETNDDKPHVFIYNFVNKKVEMSLTDFPDEVSTVKGYLVWKENKLYFTGKSDGMYSIYCLDMISREIKSVTDSIGNSLFPQMIQK